MIPSCGSPLAASRWPGSGSPARPATGTVRAASGRTGDPLFLTVNVWRQAAENVAESITRGMRAIVTGRLRQRSYETKEGDKRTVYEMEADEVGVSLRNATAKVAKVTRTSGGEARATRPAAEDDGGPWASEAPGGVLGRAAVLACLPPAG